MVSSSETSHPYNLDRTIIAGRLIDNVLVGSCYVASVRLCCGTNLRALSKCPMPLLNPGRRRRGEECSVLEFESLQGLGLVTSEFWREAAFFFHGLSVSSRDLHRSEAKFLSLTLKPHNSFIPESPGVNFCILFLFRLALGVEDTGHVTIEHRLISLLLLLFSWFFCPLVPYCFTLTVSTPSRSLFYLIISFSL